MVSACVPPVSTFEIHQRNSSIRSRKAAMAISSNPQNSPTFPRLAAASVGLLSLFGRLRAPLAARAAESLWPQISVSRVAVCGGFVTRTCGHLKSERAPLIRPGHRQVDKTLDQSRAAG